MEIIKDTVMGVMEALAAKNTKSGSNDPELLLKKILTKKELAHIKFNNLKNGIASLNVDSSSWLYNFTLEKERLLSRLREKNSLIKDIRFRLGEIK